ncbi:MAG: hypothetical protein BMS9Abin26_2025 [Gammaproteobacteria bacterium]|nr:MAG: hypothetical protein BMS9Abin26_2025 [Gammaproteobacteria bacterium]
MNSGLFCRFAGVGEDKDKFTIVDINLDLPAVSLGIGQPTGFVLTFRNAGVFFLFLTVVPGNHHDISSGSSGGCGGQGLGTVSV